MFFNLEYVQDHPIYQMQEAIKAFFNHCATKKRYSRNCFPEWFRNVLQQSSTLEDRFRKIARLIQTCDDDARQRVLTIFQNNNQIQRLCEDKNFQVEFLGDEINGLKEEIKGLFKYLYGEVITRPNLFGDGGDSSISNHHIKFREINSSVCPFCGIESYRDLGTNRRTSYDHYLAESLYPFAAVNFENLVPMCEECNEPPAKGRTDILFTSAARDVRRQVYYPYATSAGVKLNIFCRQQPSIENKRGEWDVELIPNQEEEAEKVETWNNVFKVCSRLASRIKGYNVSWISYLIAKLQEEARRDVPALRNTFKREAQILAEFTQDHKEALIKMAFFIYLADHAPEEEIDSYCQLAATEYPSIFAVSLDNFEG